MLGRVVEHKRRKSLRLEVPPQHAVLLLEIDVHSWLHRWRAPCSQTPNHSINGRSESHCLPPTHNYSLRPAPIHGAADPRQSALGARRSGCRSLRLVGDCRPCEPHRCERVLAAWTALQAKAYANRRPVKRNAIKNQERRNAFGISMDLHRHRTT